MCKVVSCLVERGYLLWPVCSLGKTLLTFVLLHFVLQGQTCLLFQLSLDFLLLHSSPLWWNGHLFLVLVLGSLVGLHRISFFSITGQNRASLVAQRLKRLPAMRETWVRSLGREDPLEKEMATHSSVLAWRIPGTGEPGGLPSMGSHRVGYDWSDLAAAQKTRVWNAVLGCNLKNDRMISVHFEGKPFNITIIQVLPQPVMLKKLKLNGSMKTYKTL